MKITILTDNVNSWFIPFGQKLQQKLLSLGLECNYVFDKNVIEYGDICFLLSCSKILQSEYLKRNKYNIVVHASDLPQGKGFSPLQWQIMEGKNEIPLTLFEAVEGVDEGPYYFKDKLIFNGYELLQEMRELLGEKIVQMCIEFAINKESYSPQSQTGESTFYPRRKSEDNFLDIDKTIREQFNKFRTADNIRFPIKFQINDQIYVLKITREK